MLGSAGCGKSASPVRGALGGNEPIEVEPRDLVPRLPLTREEGATIDFYLSANRDQLGAARFLKKALKATHTEVPRVINVDKNPSYPPAVESAKKAGYLPDETELRQVKYLNNRVECDHRKIKKLVNYGLGFKGFWTAHKTIRGYETMHMIRKGQVALPLGSHLAEVRFIESLFGIAA